MSIPFRDLELKWRKYWQDNQTYRVDLESAKNNCYCLVMFPYPSADKLHLGHWFNYAPADTWSRFKKLNGFDVFHPMGFDSFGLPAENYAIKTGVNPRETTRTNVDFIRGQLKEIGAIYDWDHEVMTSDPGYYRWTQWLFLQFFKNGLAYKKKAPVNWDPVDQTVLANEQVLPDGTAERSGATVEKKMMEQWFLKITSYAEQLLNGLDEIEWPEKTKLMQKNWIGKSQGAEVDFSLKDDSGTKIRIFTTRPDTLFGATYMVLAPEHDLVNKITTPEQESKVADYIKNSAVLSEIERTSITREKTGVFTGAYAVNPVNSEHVPIWIADYVLLSYGTGAIMAVPAHDERDFEFATKFDLPIRRVILQDGADAKTKLQEAYIGEGTMMNSESYDGMYSEKCITAITADLEKQGIGKASIQYKFRDWLISRQRYWGVPIPIIYCSKCGEVAVPDADLPVILPDIVEFKPKGVAPLATATDFVNTTCPSCGGAATRDVETMDTFVDSSWYFLRYISNQDKNQAWDAKLVEKWLPVDQYIGGVDHATMHLLYARFFIRALYDMRLVPIQEPFKNLVHQGIIKGPDGQRMSKSRGNVVNPEKYLEEYGSDTFRTYLMFGFDFRDGGPWDDSGIVAIDKFIKRVWRLVEQCTLQFKSGHNEERFGTPEKSLNKVMHHSIKGATQDIERFHFNTAISRIMELVNELYSYTANVDEQTRNAVFLKTVFKNLILIMAPFTPHIAEELWEKIGEQSSVFNQSWPQFDVEALKEDVITWVIQVNGKIRERVEASATMTTEDAEHLALQTGRIPELIAEKKIHKVIVVPRKLINIVVN